MAGLDKTAIAISLDKVAIGCLDEMAIGLPLTKLPLDLLDKIVIGAGHLLALDKAAIGAGLDKIGLFKLLIILT